MATPVISAQHLTVSEADATATLLIKLSEASAMVVTVNWSLSGLTASANTDFVNNSGTLTFNPGETQVELAIGLVNDITLEALESFVFTLSPGSNAVTGNSSTVISIVDNDNSAGTPLLTVSDVVVDESTGGAQFVVMLDKPATGNVKLDFKTQNGSASAGSDYTAINGSLTFLPGETAKTITVPVLNDTAAETWENFSLVLSKVAGATAPDLVATALIAPNDATAVNTSALTVSDVLVSEQDGFAEFMISLDKPNTDVVSVNYQSGNGTAIFNSDGITNSGTLRFAPGETLKTVRIAIINDTAVEATENFSLQLFTPSANAVINRSVGVATIIDNDAESGTPIAAVSSVVVDEADGVVSFVVTLDKPSASVITMDYASQNGTAVAGSDFTAVSGTLVFAPGETAQTVNLLINNDTLAETDESFALTLSKVSGATVLEASGTAIIAENDANAVTKPNISVEDIVVGESDVYADFIVRLDAPATSVVTMNFSTSNGTATFNNDAIGVNNVLTFAPGETVKTVRVTLVNDANVEPAENFSLQLFNASVNATIARNVATATIIDNDAEAGTPVLSVNNYVIDESAKVARFVITLDKPSANVVSLAYSTQNGSAVSGSDYVASSGSLSFAPGETAKTVTVTLINDNLAETAEAFNLVLSNLVGATALDLTGTAIIAANDKTPVSVSALSINDIVVGESQTYADFTISLDAPNTDTVTVSYQTQNGTAIFNNDGFGTSGKLTFAPGEVVKTVRVTLVNDAVEEVSENFSLVLFSPSSNATLVRNSGLATIIDNDADSGIPVVSISDLVLDEASGLATFAVTLDKPSTSVVSMNFTTQNGSAKAGSDFTGNTGALTFAPGETIKTITVFLQNDSLAESDEDFSVVLSNISGATALDPTGQAIIAANDATSVTTSNILTDDIVVGESQTYAEFTIRLDAPNTGIVTVNYSTSNGTAIFNNDAIGVNNALTFLPGETVKTVLVTLVNDTAQEITENFSLQLFSASANATIAKNVATATIIDNDAASGTPTVSINDYTIDESTREARFVITLDKPSTQVVSLDYATQNASAKAGEDFVASSGSLSFAPGETVKTVSVALINDAVFEIAESFNLVLSNLVNATSLDVAGTVVIAENDAPSVTVSTISVDDIVVGESQTFADFEVRLSAPNTDLVKVSYQTQNGSAIFNNDGVGVSGVLNFAPGETVKIVRVLLNNDTSVEPAENFNLLLFTPSSNATIVKSEATATIIDNDAVSGTPLAVISDVVLDETARTAQFVVTLDKPSIGVVSMAYTTEDGSAKAGADYVAQSGVIHFIPGETAKTVTVFLNNDTVNEIDESFNLVLSEFSGVTMLDNIGTAIIAANDSPAITQSNISVESITVDEGETYATFIARLDQPNNATITVNYSMANGTGAFNTDAINENNQLVFLPGETVKTIAIKLIDDDSVEAIESVSLQLFSPSANATISKSVTATATIVDNDAVSGTPVLSFSDTVIDETTGLVYVNASLDKPSTNTVSADFILQNATADGGDYFSYPAVIAFAPGEMVKRVAIGINNDSLTETTEVFNIAVTNVTGATLSANGLAPIAIYDNDKVPVTSSTISMSNVSVVEDQGYAEVLVTLDAPNTDVVTVSYQTSNGSAIFNNDGIGSSGKLTFAAGETVKTVRVILTDDILTEASETFTVSLFTPSANATIVTPSATVTIVDDDSAAPATAVVLTGTEQADVLTGTRFKDSISGLAGDDVLNGGVGADTLLGGLGDDSFIVDALGDVVSENADEGSDTVLSSISYSLGSQLENLVLIGVAAINATGNSLDNKLAGNDQANAFDGKTGADTMIGGLGNDNYVVNSANDVVIETSTLSSEIDVVNSSISYSLGNNVEQLVLTGTDAINGTGNGLNNKLTGNNAANQLNGGLGADTMLGGLGNDVYTVDDVADVTTETSTANNEIDLVNSSITHTLAANIEQLTLTGTQAIDGVGNNLANLLTGNNAANHLDGLAGADNMVGGLGNDSYSVDAAGDVVTETSALANEIDEVFSSVSFSLSVNVEHLTLIGNKAIDGTGNALKNRITGNDAANVLDGGTGADTLIGGLGNDTYKVDSTNDTIIESSALASEIDTVESVVTFTLVKNVEHLTLLGGNAINGFGNVLANKITGNAAANLLNGGQGADTLTGGLGNDSYVVDDSGDKVVETSSLASEIDDVTSSVSFTLGNNLENLLLSGNTAINGQGNKAANQMTGNSAANVLNGMEGADTLTGGLGNDTYFIDQLGDVISETSALKTELDTVNSFIAFTLGANLEVLNLQGNNDLTGVGNALANQLTGNSGANTLDGKAGNDTLQGGLGNDTYGVDSKGDKVIEAANAGNDTILSSLSLTLPAQVEALTLTGNKAINATGNELANLLTGNKAANKLSGGLGADTMDGGLGKDTYTVDNSSDVVIETSTLASEIDQVNSSVTYSLTTNVEKLTLTGTDAINGSGNALANTLIGNASANTLNGGSGNDALTGGNASDVLIGGIGADSINLAESVAATDTIKIAAGESLSTGFDRVTSFALGVNTTTTTGVDKLDLASKTIAANAASVNGVDKGVIKSHHIENGVITFDDNDAFTSALSLTAGDLTDMLAYLSANITKNGVTVVANLDGDAYVFQDGGAKDTLVQLTGVTVDSISNNGLAVDGVWVV